ncbi:hypothetical protein HK104_004239 [Borealophlyctis nickersoniae]|nr:hypothetical protein HK104_004239 [Borealophlyctis nickersoniae]
MLKNWTSCMSIDGKHIAVNIRKKGGYVMCPPSTKGAKQYTWDTKDEFKVPMAPLPNWILKNIVETMKMNPKHFERQEFTSDPSANSDTEDPDIQLFVDSVFWQDCFELEPQPDRNNLIRITATQPYDCIICKRKHVNITNHPFLVRNHGKLRFVCHPGPSFNIVLEPDYDQLWKDFDPLVKAFVDKGDVSDQAISNKIYEYLDGGVLGTGKTNVWRVFDRDVGLWRKENRDVIMRPFVEYFTAKLDELEFICRKLGDTGIWAHRQSTCFKASHSMKMTSTKNAQLSALYEIIRDNRDDEKFDSKLNHLHCTNKVIDLDTEEVRDARPDDYLTKSTRLEYVPYEEHPAEKKALVEKFLDDITLGDKEMKKFLLKILTSSLHGRIKFQFFFMFLGRGANGKSLLIKLMKKIFCDDHAPILSSQVTKPGVNAQSSTPALMTLKGARGAFLTELQEPTSYTEFLKMMAGGDSQSGRIHYGDQEDIPTTARLFIALNDLPIVLDKTPGFWRKIVILPFEAQFKANPDPNDPKQKQLDVEMENKLMACADNELAVL